MNKKELTTLLQVTAQEVSKQRHLLDCAKEDYRMLEEEQEELNKKYAALQAAWSERADYRHIKEENTRLERIVNRMKAEAIS